jgi:hypothetical protein
LKELAVLVGEGETQLRFQKLKQVFQSLSQQEMRKMLAI